MLLDRIFNPNVRQGYGIDRLAYVTINHQSTLRTALVMDRTLFFYTIKTLLFYDCLTLMAFMSSSCCLCLCEAQPNSPMSI